MKISQLRCLLLFGVRKDKLTPTEMQQYEAHRLQGKHQLGRMHRNYRFGDKTKSRRANWRAIQHNLAINR